MKPRMKVDKQNGYFGLYICHTNEFSGSQRKEENKISL